MPRKDEELQKDFIGFTEKTLEIMGDLPCNEYHFLNQILPYQHYHGVEHWNSTVITIEPSDTLAERGRYTDFLTSVVMNYFILGMSLGSDLKRWFLTTFNSLTFIPRDL